MAKRCLYMYTSGGKYRLPVAVADTPEELAGMLGLTVGAVYSAFSKLRNNRTRKSKYEIVFIDEKELMEP